MNKSNRLSYIIIMLGFILGVIPNFVAAQKKFKNDPNYYETFPDKITTRIYLSQKYVHLNFPGSGNAADLEYKANPKLILGAGITIKNFSLNVFNGFSF